MVITRLPSDPTRITTAAAKKLTTWKIKETTSQLSRTKLRTLSQLHHSAADCWSIVPNTTSHSDNLPRLPTYPGRQSSSWRGRGGLTPSVRLKCTGLLTTSCCSHEIRHHLRPARFAVLEESQHRRCVLLYMCGCELQDSHAHKIS